MTHEQLRPFLFGVAYRMVGTVGDAEDLVQEAFLRLHRAERDGAVIESPKAFLTTVVTRLAIDHLRSARVRREEYIGEWLPEPLLADPAPTPAAQAELNDTLSMAFLVLLESLSPLERAVFLLHDVFGYDFAGIAEVVGKSPESCRQIAARARKAVDARRPRFDPSADERREVAQRFFAALAGEGDVMELLAADVVMHGDGGGKAPAVARPLVGADRVGRFWTNLFKHGSRVGAWADLTVVNGQPGAVIRSREGAAISVMSLDVVDGRITAIRSVVNPDKLQHLGQVVNMTLLVEQLRSLAPQE